MGKTAPSSESNHQNDSDIKIKDLINFAQANGKNAVAITDVNSVSAFPKFEEKCRLAGVKPIFGAVIIHSDFSGVLPYYTTALVKNADGLDNLYKIISGLSFDGVCENVDISLLEKNRPGLLLGSCGINGPVYRILSEKRMADYKRWLDFYDFIEIENTDDDPKCRKLNIKIACDCERLNKPALDFYSVHGKKLNATEQPLEDYSYLGDQAYKVAENTNRINEMTEKVIL